MIVMTITTVMITNDEEGKEWNLFAIAVEQEEKDGGGKRENKVGQERGKRG